MALLVLRLGEIEWSAPLIFGPLVIYLRNEFLGCNVCFGIRVCELGCQTPAQRLAGLPAKDPSPSFDFPWGSHELEMSYELRKQR